MQKAMDRAANRAIRGVKHEMLELRERFKQDIDYSRREGRAQRKALNYVQMKQVQQYKVLPLVW